MRIARIAGLATLAWGALIGGIVLAVRYPCIVVPVGLATAGGTARHIIRLNG